MAYEMLRCLVALTITSSTAIVIILGLRRPVRHVFGAAASYFTWALVPVAVVVTILPRAMGALEAVPVSWASSISRLSLVVDSSLDSSLSAQSSVNWPAWLLIAWSAGASLFLLYLVVLQRTFLNSLGALSRSCGVLRAQTSAGCPALVGIFRPKIILPADFELRYTPQERSLILAHERVHLRRGDALWNALAALLRCLFWFNPLIHLAAGRLRVDQELACDAAVIERRPDSRRVYAGAMLKTQLADAALPVGCHWRSAHPLTERLKMLKQSAPGRMRRDSGRAFVVIASLAVGYFLWGTGAWGAAPVADPTSARTALLPTSAQGAIVPSGQEVRGPITVRSARTTVAVNGDRLFEDFVGDFGRTQIRADRARLTAQGKWILEGHVVATRDGRPWFMGDSMNLNLSAGRVNFETLVGPTKPIVPWALRDRSTERSR
jgi:bla regulator protein BlaR1